MSGRIVSTIGRKLSTTGQITGDSSFDPCCCTCECDNTGTRTLVLPPALYTCMSASSYPSTITLTQVPGDVNCNFRYEWNGLFSGVELFSFREVDAYCGWVLTLTDITYSAQYNQAPAPADGTGVYNLTTIFPGSYATTCTFPPTLTITP
jgi:hypothetical protein